MRIYSISRILKGLPPRETPRHQQNTSTLFCRAGNRHRHKQLAAPSFLSYSCQSDLMRITKSGAGRHLALFYPYGWFGPLIACSAHQQKPTGAQTPFPRHGNLRIQTSRRVRAAARLLELPLAPQSRPLGEKCSVAQVLTQAIRLDRLACSHTLANARCANYINHRRATRVCRTRPPRGKLWFGLTKSSKL